MCFGSRCHCEVFSDSLLVRTAARNFVNIIWTFCPCVLPEASATTPVPCTTNPNTGLLLLGRERHLGSTRWAGPLLSGRSPWPVFRTKATSTGRATPPSGFWYTAGGGKSGEVRWLPSAELGGRQAAGVLWLEARPAWALATRVKNARRSLGTLRRTRGHLHLRG